MTQSHLFKLGCRLNCSDPFAGTDRLFDTISGSFPVLILNINVKKLTYFDRKILIPYQRIKVFHVIIQFSFITISCTIMEVQIV